MRATISQKPLPREEFLSAGHSGAAGAQGLRWHCRSRVQSTEGTKHCPAPKPGRTSASGCTHRGPRVPPGARRQRRAGPAPGPSLGCPLRKPRAHRASSVRSICDPPVRPLLGSPTGKLSSQGCRNSPDTVSFPQNGARAAASPAGVLSHRVMRGRASHGDPTALSP